MKTIDVWEDRCNDGRCRSCHADIVWTETVAKGKRMPFDKPLTIFARGVFQGRAMLIIDLTKSHFATCPQATDWSRRNGPR